MHYFGECIMNENNVVELNPLRTTEAMDAYALTVEAEIWGGIAAYVNEGVHPDRLSAILTRVANELLFLDGSEVDV
jgi:hypothetical protein